MRNDFSMRNKINPPADYGKGKIYSLLFECCCDSLKLFANLDVLRAGSLTLSALYAL